MKAGRTNIDVGAKAKIVGFKGDDSIYNGLIGEVTHPFAFGCQNKGWVGLRLNEYTVYGYSLNAYYKELEIIKEQ